MHQWGKTMWGSLMDYSADDEHSDDIVSRLEKLRKKPREIQETKDIKKKKAPSSGEPPDEKRKKLFRLVGAGVIAIVFIGILFAGFNLYTGEKSEKALVEQERLAAIAALENAKSVKLAEIDSAFFGLPDQYTGEKGKIRNAVSNSQSISQLNGISAEPQANQAWQMYTRDKLDKAVVDYGEEDIKMNVSGAPLVVGYQDILVALGSMNHGQLRSAKMYQLKKAYIPLELSRSNAGAFPSIGDIVDIYYVDSGQTVTLAKDSRVVALIRSSSSITLSESETKQISGQGGEAKGESTISTGGVSPVTGPISIGVKQSQSSTTYSVDLKEIIKAAAANKLQPGFVDLTLKDYGLNLGLNELKTQVGELETTYLLLLEVKDDEIPGLVPKVLTGAELANIQIVIRESSTLRDG